MTEKIQLRRAERRKAKLRVGVSGPSGSGKTMSALLIARGLVGAWEKIALIDTENGSGELYSDLGPYNVITLQAPYSPERYIEAIQAAEEAGMEAIVIDSTSHEWDGKGGCLEINDLIARTKFKGNTWSAWSETTPRHQRFIEAITGSVAHVITTARSKTDTIQTDDKKVKKIGLKEIQREGFEYELTVNFTLDRDGHHAMASKDRTKLFSERDPFVITQKTGEELKAWSESGAEPVGEDPKLPMKRKVVRLLRELHEDTSTIASCNAAVKRHTQLELTDDTLPEVAMRLDALVEEIKEANGGKVPVVEKAPAPAAAAPAAEAPAQQETLLPAEESETPIGQEAADKILGEFEDEDPKRPKTREELDGSVWLVYPDGKRTPVSGPTRAPGSETPQAAPKPAPKVAAKEPETAN